MTAYRDDLVNEVLRNLSAPVEIVGTLLVEATSSVTTLVVAANSLEDLKPGVFEVGSELVYAQTVDAQAGLLSNVIRGYLGTTAATQAVGSVVRLNPATPRVNVIRALNDTLSGLHPRVYAVATDQDVLTDYTVFELPSTCVDVLDVSLVTPDSPEIWRKSRRWKYVDRAPEVTSGKCLQVYDAWDGCEVKVTYATAPGTFSEASGTNEAFTTVTGLPEWCRELVTLGASWRLANFMEARPPMVVGDAVQQGESPTRWATQLYAMFNEALDAAERRLRALNDVGVIHYER